MITCEEIRRELSSYLDGEVAWELRNHIQQHLRLCHNCTVLMNTTRKTLTLIAGHCVSELPQGVPQRLMERLGIR